MSIYPENANRAFNAEKALDAFKAETNVDDCDALPDLLCNLMHLAHFEGIDFAAMLERAKGNFEAELNGE